MLMAKLKHREYGNSGLVVNLAHAILEACIGCTSSPPTNISAIGKAVDFFKLLVVVLGEMWLPAFCNVASVIP